MESIPKENAYGPRSIFTEDIFQDIKNFFYRDEDTSVEEIHHKFSLLDKNHQHKLIVLTERVEFVCHLNEFKKLLAENKQYGPWRTYSDGEDKVVEIPEKIEFHRLEFNGVDHDIDAVSFYLLLTCIECIEGNPEYVEMANWFEENWDTLYKPGETPQACIKRIKEIYYERYGTRRNFKRAFTDRIPNSLKIRLVTNFALVKLENHELDESSWQSWQSLEEKQKLVKITNYLYDNVRNKFTHESHRSFFPDIPICLLPSSHDKVLIALVPPEYDNLLLLLQDLICILVKKYLGLAKSNVVD